MFCCCFLPVLPVGRDMAGGVGVKSFDLGGLAVAWLSYFLLIKVSEILCIFRDFSDRSYFLSHNLLLH